MYKVFKLFLLLFFFNSAYAQYNENSLNRQIDSLLVLTKAHQEADTLSLNLYESLYDKYFKLNRGDAGEFYAKKTIELAEKLDQQKYIPLAYFRVGFYHHQNSRFLVAEEYYLKAISNFSSLNDKSDLAGIYLNLSAMYASLPDYVKALDANFKAVEIYSENKELQSIAGCYVNISSAYKGLKQFKNASLYLEKAIEIFEKDERSAYGSALSYVNLGKIYFEADQRELATMGVSQSERYQKVLWYLQRAESYKLSDEGLSGSIYQLRGDVFQSSNDKKQAAQNYQLAVATFKSINSHYDYAKTLISLARLHQADKEHSRAMELLKEALVIAEKNKVMGVQRDANFELYTLSEHLGNFSEALQYYKAYILFKEQIFNEEKEREITRKRMQLDFSIKEKDYKAQQDFQIKISILLGLIVLITLVAVVLIYRSKQKTAKLNQVVTAQAKELEDLNKVKDRIFSVVSHDMRTPVNTLLSFIQLLESGNVSPEKLTRYANTLKHTLSYTSTMMENLLNWAYSQMEGFKPKLISLPVAATIKNLIAAMTERAQEKQINLRFVDEENISALADRDMLMLVMRNLLSNAIKFTPQNGFIEVVVSHQFVDNEKLVAITVSDSGTGFSDDEVIHFNQNNGVNKSTLGTNNEKGTGIGLSLCKSFTSLMGGKLLLKSQLNNGSSFMLFLPKG
jgi:signal transduction histidine kinase